MHRGLGAEPVEGKTAAGSGQVVFNILSVTAVGIWLTYLGYQYAVVLFRGSLPLPVLAAGCIYFLTNTIPVSAIIALFQRVP